MGVWAYGCAVRPRALRPQYSHTSPPPYCVPEDTMAALTLTREQYRNKVYGGWLGKNAGGTLGNPVEGRKEPLSLTFYDPIPGQAAWNEDLDFQLVWLTAIRQHGP